MIKRLRYLKMRNTVCAVLTICFAFSISISFADIQVDDPSYQSLLQTLGNVQQNYTVRYTFTQEKKIAALSRPLISDGFMLYDKNNGMYMEYRNPVWTAYLLIGNDVFEKLQNDSPYKQIMLPKGTNVGLILKSLVAADIDSLSKYFSLEFHQEGKPWKLTLKPSNGSSLGSLKEIVLTGERYYKKLLLMEQNGDRTYLMFTPSKSAGKGLSSQERKYFIH